MVQVCALYYCWLLPYLMVVNQMNTNGFKIGVNEYNNDYDLPLCYGTFVPSWTNVLYSIIAQDNVVPSREVMTFIKGCNGNGYSFFCYGNTKFCTNLMDIPAYTFAKNPKKDS